MIGLNQTDLNSNPGRVAMAEEATPLLVCVCLIASMGGLLFGYDWVVIGGAKPFFTAYFGIASDPDLVGLAMSCALAGCLVGALASGILSDRYGRKKLLVVAAWFFLISALGTGLAPGLSAFVVFRVLGGIGIGLASSLSPMYISEVAPTHLRGSLVALNQLTIYVGLLAAQLVNWLLVRKMPQEFSTEQIVVSWYGQYAWRWMFAAAAVPALFFLLLLIIAPESPRWLVSKNRDQQAFGVLTALVGHSCAQSELTSIRASLPCATESANLWRSLTDSKMIRVILIGMMLAVLQQWCGLNAIFYYAEDIFRSAGYSINGVMLNILLTGVISLAFTVAAIFTVDRWGRRPLMLLGTAGIAILMALLGMAFYFRFSGWPTLVIVLMTMALYAFTLAPIMWVLLAELFPNRIRGAALSISVATLWITCWALAQFFPRIRLTLNDAGSFWLFSAICFVGFALVWRFVPETKGRSLEEIEIQLIGKPRTWPDRTKTSSSLTS